MSYGVRIWGADGALQMDENSFTVRIVLSQIVTFTNVREVKTFSVPGCNTSNSVASVIPIGEFNSGTARQFESLMRDDGVAEVANWIRGFAGTQTATGSMRLLVMRFR